MTTSCPPSTTSFEELSDILRPAAASGKMVGMDLTIFNPRRDPAGSITDLLVDFLVASLADLPC